MSAAVAEPLPDLTASFQAALKATPAVASEGEASAEAKAASKAGMDKAMSKETVAKEAPKEGAEHTKEVAKETVAEVPTKKKSALDAIMSDEGETAPAASDGDAEVQALLKSDDPNWPSAKATIKRQNDEIKSLRKQTEKSSEQPPEITKELTTLREEAKRLKAENDQYRDAIVAVDVRLDPQVQQKLSARDKQVASVAERIKESGADHEQFIAIMDLPLAKRAAALDAMLEGITSTRARTSIEAKLALIETSDEQLEEMLNNPHQTAEQFAQKRDTIAREEARRIEEVKAATLEKVSREMPKLSKLMRPAPADTEGAEEYNATLKADMDRAPQMLSAKTREEATVFAYKAARYDSLEKLVMERNTRVSALEAELKKYEGAEPGFRGNGKVKPKADYERPIEDVFREALGAGRGH